MGAREHAVVVAGAGPTGLMLAGELTLAGVDVVVVERRPNQDLDGRRAGGLHARTLEVLDQRGIVERFLEAGQVSPALGYALVRLDLGDFPSRHNYVLALWQSHIERLMAGWIDELGVPVIRGAEVVGFTQDDRGVDVAVSGGVPLRAQYLVGCDGGRSLVRKVAGIDFPGLDPTTSWMLAEVEMDEEPELGFRRDSVGQHAIGRREPGEPIGVVLTEREVGHDGDPTMDELRAALIGVYGTDYGLRRASRITRFTDVTRQAASYRQGRVLLAGDAAHVHPPQGGQGLNTGVQDAVNLGWKLAQVVAGRSPDALLDTYHAERHPVGAWTLRHTMVEVVLARPDERHQAVRADVTEMLAMDEPRRHFAGKLSGLDIRYDLGDGHPLLGRRVPDLDLDTTDGPTRVYGLLHEARPVLLALGPPGRFDISPWADRVRLVAATTEGGPWELPVIGAVDAPAAVLIRPDGYVAWAGDLADPALPDALTRWFGAAVSAST
ncbi:MAG: FAD-dependent monooxygenase [Ilumatobacteraceae bacterium]